MTDEKETPDYKAQQQQLSDEIEQIQQEFQKVTRSAKEPHGQRIIIHDPIAVYMGALLEELELAGVIEKGAISADAIKVKFFKGNKKILQKMFDELKIQAPKSKLVVARQQPVTDIKDGAKPNKP